MAKYEILTQGKDDNISVIFASTGVRGLALSNNGCDGDGEITAILAQPSHSNYLGNLTRDVTATGLPSSGDLLYRDSGATERLEDPDKSGGKVTVEDVEMFAAEGDMLGVTNPITASSVKNQMVTFKDGLPVIAAPGDYAHFQIVGFPDPVEEGNTLRVIMRRVKTHVVVASES